MVGFILRALFFVLLFQLGASVFRWFRRGTRRRDSVENAQERDPVDRPDYSELTPYEIEDAEYEELPKRED